MIEISDEYMIAATGGAIVATTRSPRPPRPLGGDMREALHVRALVQQRILGKTRLPAR
jgi:hypothetical protein